MILEKVFPGSLSDLLENLYRQTTAKKASWLLTLNFEMIARALRLTDYLQLLHETDLLIADGMPVVLYARIRGKKIQRITGVDLLEAALEDARFTRIALIGGQDIDRMLAICSKADRSRYLVFNEKNIQASSFVAKHSAVLKSFEPQLIFLALGVPKQDELASLLRDKLLGGTIVGVGGAFDFLAGLKPRSPRWMGCLGLEWLHRLATEPRRLSKRYLIHYPAGFARAILWLFRSKY